MLKDLGSHVITPRPSKCFAYEVYSQGVRGLNDSIYSAGLIFDEGI
jgi:hypothetical protein